jgi:hypothetical protein
MDVSPQSRGFLENIIVNHIETIFPTCHGTWRFVAVFTTAHHEPDESSPNHPLPYFLSMPMSSEWSPSFTFSIKKSYACYMHTTSHLP